jgi:ABC-2 type transport system ATP-binding protein
MRVTKKNGGDPIIVIEGLSKEYGTFRALDALNLTIERGEIFGFLGPNGAGKTTTIRLLMGILVPTSGRIVIDGLDSQRDRVAIKRRVGYLPDQPNFHGFLRGREIVEFVGEMHGQSRREARANAGRLLDELMLADAAEEFAVNYSLGMKKKLGLACALIHDPAVLILDEPTSGLDPRASRELQDRLQERAASGKTVFLSTHMLDMAERLCSRVGIIYRSHLIGDGSLAEVKEKAAAGASLEDAFLQLTQPDQSAS